MNLELLLGHVLNESGRASVVDDLQTEGNVLRQALDDDTTAAALMWGKIADGSATIGMTLVWAQHVAGRIKQDVIEAPPNTIDPNSRARAALVAVGFRAQIREFVLVESLLKEVEIFHELDKDGNTALDKEGLPVRSTAAKLTKIVKASGLLAIKSDKQTKRVIERLRPNKPKKQNKNKPNRE